MEALGAIRPEEFTPLLAGADYGELYLERCESGSIRFEDSRVEDVSSGLDRGMALRYLRRTADSIETLFGSACALDRACAQKLRRDLLGAAKDGPASRPALTARAPLLARDPRAWPLDEKISLLARLDRAVRGEFPCIRQVSLSYREHHKSWALLNNEGDFRREERSGLVLSISVVAEKDGLLQTGQSIIGGLKGRELLDDFNPFSAAREAASRAVSKLSAPKAKAGEMPVVLSSSAGGTFIHEAIGHSLEADLVHEGSSPAYQGKIGSVVAPPEITVIDDPTLPFHRGSFAFDDEGVSARPTPLVKNGVLQDFLYDRLTAMKDGKPSNGHGRRESFQHRPIPRMSNLYIAPGKEDPRGIISSLKAGLLVTRMGGGQVNTATGEFVFEVDEGFWVEDGEIRHLVRDANLLGVGPAALGSIDRVGWDIGWGIGTCGKDGQGVPVGDGQPTLRMPKILIGGRHA